jgi:hypothetical protein
MVGLLLNYSITDKWAFLKIVISIIPVYIMVCFFSAVIGQFSDQPFFIYIYRTICILSLSVMGWLIYNSILTVRYGFITGETRVKVPTFKRLDLLGFDRNGVADPRAIYFASFIASATNPYTICILLSNLIIYNAEYFKAAVAGSGFFSEVLVSFLSCFCVCIFWVFVIYGFYGMLIFYGREYLGPTLVKWATIVTCIVLMLLFLDMCVKFILGPVVKHPTGYVGPATFPYAMSNGYLFHNWPLLDMIF